MASRGYICALGTALFLAVGGGSAWGAAESGSAIIEQLGAGRIDWSQQKIVVTGHGAPISGIDNLGIARLESEKKALEQGRALLAQVLGEVRVTGPRTLQRTLSGTRGAALLQAILGRSIPLETRFYSDGSVDVRLSVGLDGPLLATLAENGGRPKAVPTRSEAIHTGLIIDARGLGLQPSLLPQVYDENRQLIYGAPYVEPADLERAGVAVFVGSMEAARSHDRAGDKPLVLKGLALGPQVTDVVLATVDADRLRDPTGNVGFLSHGRVVVVVDQR